MSDRYQRAICASCRVRFRVEPLSPHEYNVIPIDRAQLKQLENAARHFDAVSPERFTAAEFIEWLRPDVRGTPEYQARLQVGEPRQDVA